MSARRSTPPYSSSESTHKATHIDRAGQNRAGLFGRPNITCALSTAGAGENAEAAATRAAATAVRVNIVRVEVGRETRNP